MEAAAAINVFPSRGKNIFKKDKLVKLISIPVLAASIVNITGLITNIRYNALHLIINYSYFILIAWGIWQGNVWLMISLKKSLQLSNKPYYKSILILYTSVICYTTLVAGGGLMLWLAFSTEDSLAYKHVLTAVVIIVVVALFYN
jgi:hypothetical protein